MFLFTVKPEACPFQWSDLDPHQTDPLVLLSSPLFFLACESLSVRSHTAVPDNIAQDLPQRATPTLTPLSPYQQTGWSGPPASVTSFPTRVL